MKSNKKRFTAIEVAMLTDVTPMKDRPVLIAAFETQPALFVIPYHDLFIFVTHVGTTMTASEANRIIDTLESVHHIDDITGHSQQWVLDYLKES